MKARYFGIALAWTLSLVGVGLWAQGSSAETYSVTRGVDGSMSIRRGSPTQATGAVTGRVEDSQGGVIAGATVVLISESSGSRSVPAVTNSTGDYLFATVGPDTYTIEVTMPGFRPLRRAGVTVSDGDRVAVPALVIEPGGSIQRPRVARPGDTLGPVIAGDDIGFQPVFTPNTPAGVVTGRWMVRIGGEWYEASAAMLATPAR